MEVGGESILLWAVSQKPESMHPESISVHYPLKPPVIDIICRTFVRIAAFEETDGALLQHHLIHIFSCNVTMKMIEVQYSVHYGI